MKYSPYSDSMFLDNVKNQIFSYTQDSISLSFEVGILGYMADQRMDRKIFYFRVDFIYIFYRPFFTVESDIGRDLEDVALGRW